MKWNPESIQKEIKKKYGIGKIITKYENLFIDTVGK